MCFDRFYIDFTQFSAALIIGKIENNDSYSNGVGKTSIFKAIEYALFNQADVNLENIVRDDSGICRVVLDFLIGDQEYRLSRSRTKKGTTDLILLQRGAEDGTEEEVYHKITTTPQGSNYDPYLDEEATKKYWKELSGGRASDTEKDLAKLIKYTHKSFRSTVHFMQNDMAGLPTVTAEKRKGILKDAFNLMIYPKLEKIAKEKMSQLNKELERHNTLLENIGDPAQELISLADQLAVVEQILITKNEELNILNQEITTYQEQITNLTQIHAALETKFASLLTRETAIIAERGKLEISVKEYTTKKSNAIKAAKDIIEEIKTLKSMQAKLSALDYTQIDILSEQVIIKRDEIAKHNASIKSDMEKYEELKIPLPNDARCKHCRQTMTEQHRQDCQSQIPQQMSALQANIQTAKKAVIAFNKEISDHQQIINSLNLSKQQFEGINTKIANKNKEYQDKNELHNEYATQLEKHKNDLSDKSKELELVQEELKNSSLEEANNLKIQIQQEKQKVANIVAKTSLYNKEITHYNSSRAVMQHSIDQRTKDKQRKVELKQTVLDLEKKIIKYPSVIQGFSSTGIPNLIIQDMLDDLQIEANNLLNLLKPGLQLSFLIEKTVEKTGEQADTLDIKYYVNGRERYYEQLSGAMRLAVAFSLKLGLSFLLQKRLWVDIKFLLLDEIDQSLDKAGVDALTEIIKFFQKDFTVLVITHNDRLKDKFTSHILVEQDLNMVSRAGVVTSFLRD